MVGRPVLKTAATAEPISLTLAKQQLRYDAGDTSQDDYLNLLIAVAREEAETFTCRGYIAQTWVEYYDGFPGAHFPFAALSEGISAGGAYVGRRRHRHHHDYLELSRSPLKTLTSVKYIDPDGNTQTWDPANYVLNDKQDPAQISRAPGVCWPQTKCVPNSVFVEYVVGYSDDDAKVPAMAKQAMLLMISDWDANRLPMKVQSGTVTDLLMKNRVFYQP